MAPPFKPRRRPGEFGGGGRKFTPRRKVCTFCVDKIPHADYKDLGRLRRFLSERGKIEPRRKTGTCAPHQRSLNVALKRARHLALLPYTAEHIRVTGVVIREPGSSYRGPRPPRPMAPEAPQDAASTEASQDTVVTPETAQDGAAEAAPTQPEAVPDTAPTAAAEDEPAPAASAT